jgi:hypothetical protein
MSIELGHFSLILAFAISAISAILGLFYWRSAGHTVLYLRQAAVLQFLLVAAAFAALIQAFVVSDFSLALAYEHSHSAQPLIYKITAVWGNHEGSMVLWVLILVAMGAAVAVFGRNAAARPGGAGSRHAEPAGCRLSQASRSSPPTLSRGCRPRRSRARTSTPSCRTSASPCIRRCSMPAMSASRSASPLPLRR